jgi:hypothetical protein
MEFHNGARAPLVVMPPFLAPTEILLHDGAGRKALIFRVVA